MYSHPLPSHISRENLGPWQIFLQQAEAVAPQLDKARWPWVETLLWPKRSLIVDVPTRLDNGEVARFEGYRTHHNTSRGPGKGGIRVDPRQLDSRALPVSWAGCGQLVKEGQNRRCLECERATNRDGLSPFR